MMHQSRSAEIAATVADPSPVLQLIVVSAVEILQGAAGVIALLEDQSLVPRASYGLPAGALGGPPPGPRRRDPQGAGTTWRAGRRAVPAERIRRLGAPLPRARPAHAAA